MKHAARRRLSMAGLLLALLTGFPSRQHAARPPGCAAGAIFDLAFALGRPLTPAQQAQLAAQYPEGEPVSMLDLTLAANDYGIELQGYEATLHELRDVRGPAVLHLFHPDHFVVLLLRDDMHCQLCDNARISFVTWEELALRYTGHALILPQDRETGPVLEVGPVRLNPDRPPERTMVWQAFVRNAGDEPLALSTTGASCDCLSVEPTEATVQPTGEVELELTLEGGSAGAMYQAYFTSTDPYWPTFVLECGTRPLWKVTLSFGSMPPTPYIKARKGSGARRTFRVGLPVAVEIKAIETGSPLLTATEPVDHSTSTGLQLGRRRWLADLLLSPDAPPGRFEATVRVLTTSKAVPVAEKDIRVEVVPDLKLIPARLFFGIVPADEPVTRSFSVIHRDGEAFELAPAEGHDKRLTVEVDELRGGRRLVDVTFQAGQPGIVRTELVLTADVPQEERIVIPVYAEVL